MYIEVIGILKIEDTIFITLNEIKNEFNRCNIIVSQAFVKMEREVYRRYSFQKNILKNQYLEHHFVYKPDAPNEPLVTLPIHSCKLTLLMNEVNEEIFDIFLYLKVKNLFILDENEIPKIRKELEK